MPFVVKSLAGNKPRHGKCVHIYGEDYCPIGCINCYLIFEGTVDVAGSEITDLHITWLKCS